MNPLDVLRQQYLEDLEEDEDHDYKLASISNESINCKFDQVSIGKKQINRSLTKLLLPFPVSYPKKMPRKLVNSREILDSTLLASTSQETGQLEDSQDLNKYPASKIKQDDKKDQSQSESLETMEEFLVKTRHKTMDNDFEKQGQSNNANLNISVPKLLENEPREGKLGQLETMKEFLVNSEDYESESQQNEPILVQDISRPAEPLETMQEFLLKSDTILTEQMPKKHTLTNNSVRKDKSHSRSKSNPKKQIHDEDKINSSQPAESVETMQEFLLKSDPVSTEEMPKKYTLTNNSFGKEKSHSRSKSNPKKQIQGQYEINALSNGPENHSRSKSHPNKHIEDQDEINASQPAESLEAMKEFPSRSGTILTEERHKADNSVKEEKWHSGSNSIQKSPILDEAEIIAYQPAESLQTMDEFLEKSEAASTEEESEKEKITNNSVQKEKSHSRSKSSQKKEIHDEDASIASRPTESLDTMQDFIAKSETLSTHTPEKHTLTNNSVKKEKGHSRSKSHPKNQIQDQDLIIASQPTELLEKSKTLSTETPEKQTPAHNSITEIDDTKLKKSVEKNLDQWKAKNKPIKTVGMHYKSKSANDETIKADEHKTDSKKNYKSVKTRSQSHLMQVNENERNIPSQDSIEIVRNPQTEVIHDSSKGGDSCEESTSAPESLEFEVENQRKLSKSDSRLEKQNLEPSKTNDKYDPKTSGAKKKTCNSKTRDQSYDLDLLESMKSNHYFSTTPDSRKDYNVYDALRHQEDMKSEKNDIRDIEYSGSGPDQFDISKSDSPIKYSDIPQTDSKHLLSERISQLKDPHNIILTIQPVLTIDHKKISQAQTKVSKTNSINNIETHPNSSVTHASVLKRMIPDLSKEPTSFQKKEGTPSVSLPKSILKKPQSRERSMIFQNNKEPSPLNVEEQQLDLKEEFDLKPSGLTKIISQTTSCSSPNSSDNLPDQKTYSSNSNTDLTHKPTLKDIPNALDVLPPIIRAKTAPTVEWKHNSIVQTFDHDLKLADQKNPCKTLEDIENASEDNPKSRAASPSGYMIAYKMSSQKLHFDPGVYRHFKGIQSAKVWLQNKNLVQKKSKSNTIKTQNNLSSIDENIGSSRAESPKTDDGSNSSFDKSESDDESLRRVAVRQASFTALDVQDLSSTKVDLLVFDASTQTQNNQDENGNKGKKVRINAESPNKGESTLKRASQIQIDVKPSKYMDKYLSFEKKKLKKLPPLKSPMFAPIKSRPISKSSSSRSSRSSSPILSEKPKKKTKARGKNYKTESRILNSASPTQNHNHQNEYQLDPYMPASWYLPYDYLSQQTMPPLNEFNSPSNAHFGSPNSQYMNAPQFNSSPYYSTIQQISQPNTMVQYLESNYVDPSLYSSLPVINSQPWYSQSNLNYSQPKLSKTSKKTQMPKEYIDHNQQIPINQAVYETPNVYPNDYSLSKKTKSLKNSTDLLRTRPWH